MSREEALKKINEILIDEFEDDDLVISESTVAADVDGWDSLAHLSIINEIENEFGIKFLMGEIQEMKNIGEMIDIIISRL